MGKQTAVTRWRDSAARTDAPRTGDMHIELDPSDHEEPTWEVRGPADPRRKRIDRRTRTILALAAVIAVVVNAGAALIYWQVSKSETEQAVAGTSISLALRARTDLDRPLTRGATGNLVVTVTNDYDTPVRITSLTPGLGNIVADDEHRDAGCTAAPVALTKKQFDVRWDVPRNTIGAFTVPGAVAMAPDANQGCLGAFFTVPVKAVGVSRDAS